MRVAFLHTHTCTPRYATRIQGCRKSNMLRTQNIHTHIRITHYDTHTYIHTCILHTMTVAVKHVAHKKLPGIVTDNWSMNKGALGRSPHGDDPKLPGVKAFGW